MSSNEMEIVEQSMEVSSEGNNNDDKNEKNDNNNNNNNNNNNTKSLLKLSKLKRYTTTKDYGIPGATLSTLDVKFLEVFHDKYSCKYNNNRKDIHAYDYGSIRSSLPFPDDVLVSYFEVEITDMGSKGLIGVGIADKHFPLHLQPGTEQTSYAYFGDGKIYKNESAFKADSFSDGFGTGDVIGCGVIFLERSEVFFTKNGKFLGTAFRNVAGTFYPVIGLHSHGEAVQVNFGQRPWAFDIETWVSQLRKKLQKRINKVEIPAEDVQCIIQNYLLHYGYEDTLRSFQQSSSLQFKDTPSLENSLTQRKNIRSLILSGKIEEAIQQIKRLFPTLLDQFPSCEFYLQCQIFIELLKTGKLDTAIQFAQEVLMPLSNTAAEAEKQYFQEIIGLLAFEDSTQSPLRHFTQTEHRDLIADKINQHILEIEKNTKPVVLETNLKQLYATRHSLRLKADSQGEVFHLKDYV